MPARITFRAMRVATVLMLIVLMPVQARAVSTSQRELEEVRRSTPSRDRGAELYGACVMCHGSDGRGTLDGQVPCIAGQHATVLGKQLVDYRYDRRWDLRMESIADRHHLPDAQAIADVVAYISGLRRDFPIGHGDGSLVRQGADTYSRLCRGCHGDLAQGDATKAIPRLAGQHYEYLRRQIYDAVDGRRPNFSPSHVRLLARLDRDGIAGMADYLSRLEGGDPQAPHGSK